MSDSLNIHRLYSSIVAKLILGYFNNLNVKPKYYWCRNTKLDEDLFDVVFQIFGIQTPRRLLTRCSTGRWVRSTTHRLHFCWKKYRKFIRYRASHIFNLILTDMWGFFKQRKKTYHKRKLFLWLTRWSRREQLIEKPLGCRQNLLRQFCDQILGKLLELVAFESGQGFAHGRSKFHTLRLKNNGFILFEPSLILIWFRFKVICVHN